MKVKRGAAALIALGAGGFVAFWVAVARHSDRQPESTPRDAAAARVVYIKYCSPCHGVNGEGVSAPRLKGTSLTVETISRTILEGKGRMPSFAKDMVPSVAEPVAEAVKRL